MDLCYYFSDFIMARIAIFCVNKVSYISSFSKGIHSTGLQNNLGLHSTYGLA